MNSPVLPIAITCGDPAGVGPEIITRWAATCTDAENFRILGPKSWVNTFGKLGLPVGPDGYQATPGKPDPDGAKLAWQAMQVAADGCGKGHFSAVVTGPVSKAALAQVGYPYPGQTEFFADQWGGNPVMAFAGGKMRVVLATWHQPLMSVGPFLRTHPEVLERAVQQAVFLARTVSGDREPSVAVCGLNPHAGEEGLLGDEEQQWLNPLLQQLRHRFPGVSSALPGDTVFYRHLQGEFDAVVALYHDQGLAPLKTVEFNSAVNITLGLPFIRTSPDHGTAFSLAGKQVADIGSFCAAIEWARKLSVQS